MSEKGDRMTCSIWSGWMFGIYIGFPNRYKHFKEENKNQVEIIIEDNLCKASLPPSFWNNCPEIRVARDGNGRNRLSEWIKKNNLMPTTSSKRRKGKEDRITLEIIEPYRKFRIGI